MPGKLYTSISDKYFLEIERIRGLIISYCNDDVCDEGTQKILDDFFSAWKIETYTLAGEVQVDKPIAECLTLFFNKKENAEILRDILLMATALHIAMDEMFSYAYKRTLVSHYTHVYLEIAYNAVISKLFGINYDDSMAKQLIEGIKSDTFLEHYLPKSDQNFYDFIKPNLENLSQLFVAAEKIRLRNADAVICEDKGTKSTQSDSSKTSAKPMPRFIRISSVHSTLFDHRNSTQSSASSSTDGKKASKVRSYGASGRQPSSSPLSPPTPISIVTRN